MGERTHFGPDKEQGLSPALQIMSVFWKRVRVLGWSGWSLHNPLREALSLIIRSGLEFDLGDFQYMYSHFELYQWGGTEGGLAEGLYSLAVRTGHLQAARSFEQWKDRKPFMADGANSRKRDRLAVRSQFKWKGELVMVTSFAGDGGSLIACSYHDDVRDEDGNWLGIRIKHRYRITRQDLRRARARRK